jgi:Fe-S cluster assembly iron-binding protein IscA
MKLVLDNTGCAGTKYGIQLTDEINKRDIVHKRSGLEIVIPEDFYEYFRNATIDVDETNKFKITVKSDSPEKTI